MGGHPAGVGKLLSGMGRPPPTRIELVARTPFLVSLKIHDIERKQDRGVAGQPAASPTCRKCSLPVWHLFTPSLLSSNFRGTSLSLLSAADFIFYFIKN